MRITKQCRKYLDAAPAVWSNREGGTQMRSARLDIDTSERLESFRDESDYSLTTIITAALNFFFDHNEGKNK